jgi:5-methylcytosine-specific restriction endonuclease McrA
MNNKSESGLCELCLRETSARYLTLHHLLPRQKGGKAEHRVWLCRTCHNQIHKTFTNAELAREFASLEALRQAPALSRFLAWIVRQKPDRMFRSAQARR